MVRIGRAAPGEGVARERRTEVDTWFAIMLAGAALIAAAGPIVWTSAILRSSAGASPCERTRDADETRALPPERLTRHLDTSLAQLDRLLRATCKRAGARRTIRGGRPTVSPYTQLRIQNMFMETHACLRRIDEASRRPYESRVADLSDMAESAGIRWTPGPYRPM